MKAIGLDRYGSAEVLSVLDVYGQWDEDAGGCSPPYATATALPQYSHFTDVWPW